MLLPPKKYMELCERHFDWLDADSTSLAIGDEGQGIDEDDDLDQDDDNVGWPPHCEVEVFTSPELDGEDAEEEWDLQGRPVGDWAFDQTHFVAVGQGENEGQILVLCERNMQARWFDADKARVRLSTPAQVSGRQPKLKSVSISKTTVSSSSGSAQKPIGPSCPRGLLREKVFSKGRDAAWFCIVAYSRLSEDAQDLDKFLCDMFLDKIRDYALRDVCRRQSGGRFTKAYMTWVILAGANPGAQVIDALYETRLTYESVDHLAALMPKRKEAAVNTTTEQRLCWEALRVQNKGIAAERDTETKDALCRMRVKSLDDFSVDPTRGAEVYDAAQLALENFVKTRATQAAVLRSEDKKPRNPLLSEEWNKMRKKSFAAFCFGGECHALLKQYCWRNIFLDKCSYGNACKFSHDEEGRELLKKELGAKEFERRRKQCEQRWGANEDRKEAVIKEALGTSRTFASLMRSTRAGKGQKQAAIAALLEAAGAGDSGQQKKGSEEGGGAGRRLEEGGAEEIWAEISDGVRRIGGSARQSLCLTIGQPEERKLGDALLSGGVFEQ